MTEETLGFKAEVQQLLDLMVHSLYSHKEIFLRELISNASDAADRLRFEALSDDSLYAGDGDLGIRVAYDKDARTLTVSDNGIGMSRDEVVDNIGTIAKSGTREFFSALTGDRAKDAQIIGQFGVGFYASFIVADKVTLTTRRAGLAPGEGVRWSSDGKGEYTLETVEKPTRGTDVVLHLRAAEDEFLDGYRLRAIITKYSDHISLPIRMPKEGGDSAESGEDEVVNSATALWTLSKSEIEENDYHEFYKHVAHDFDPPLDFVHTKVEGKLEYTSLLFIPAHAPFDLWDPNSRRGIKLYVRRVFIMDDAEQLMPSYLRFVKGVVDSNDLPLNISREILQHNKQIDAMRAGSVKKILGLLEKMAEHDAERYAKFWAQFGRVLKEGIIEDAGNRETIAKLMRFASTHSDADAQDVSLDDYVERMHEGQQAIYYITGDSITALRNSPHLEIFREKGVEVLLMTDGVDEWVVTHLTEYQGKKLQSVNKGELDLEALDAQAKKREAKPKGDKRYRVLAGKIGKVLGDRVKDVRTTRRLTNSPACLVADEHEMGAHLERLLKAAGHEIGGTKPILEINPAHPMVKRMLARSDAEDFADWAHILHDQAVLSEGGQLQDPPAFVKRLNDIFQTLAGEESAPG